MKQSSLALPIVLIIFGAVWFLSSTDILPTTATLLALALVLGGLALLLLDGINTQSIVHATNPRGEDIYWIGAVGAVADNEQDTDFATCESGYVSITPLQIDLTAYSQMHALDEYWQGLTFE